MKEDTDWVNVSIDNNYNIRRKEMDPDIPNKPVSRGYPWVFEYQANAVIGDSETWHKGLPEDYTFNSSGKIINMTRLVPVHKEESVFIDSNPKTAFGAVKPGSFQTPMMPFYEYSLAHYQGALKYGHMNWREDPVSISTYIEAARRHIDLYLEGQKYSSDIGVIDPETGEEMVRGIHNLAHAMTCLSIVIDAEWYGTLIDDRTTFGNAKKMEEYFEETKALRQHLAKTWTGHAQKLKDKLKANKENK